MSAKKTVVAYKGFDLALKCRGHQFEGGKTYTHEGDVAACKSGFHACEYPLDVFGYYAPAQSRYAIVEQSGILAHHGRDSKIASSVITIKAELSLHDLIQAATDYTFTRAQKVEGSTSRGVGKCASSTGYQGAASSTGDYGAASSTGDYGAASSTGDYGAASSTGVRGAASSTGDYGAASSTGFQGAASSTGFQGAASSTGDYGAASSTGRQGAASSTGEHGAASSTGFQGAASSTGEHGAASSTGEHGAASSTGYRGAASSTGDYGVAMSSGYEGRVMGAEGNALFLVERDTDYVIVAVWAGIVGRDGIKPHVWYVLKNGKPVEVTQ